MKLLQHLKEMARGASTWDKIRLGAIVVLLSPIILAVYLGMWAEGWLDGRND